ncbi:protein translocase subunit SecF [Paenibacillus montanisoli]|uniref:Protein-export membrane protein SecF n=1 Tax=Paenibacillus montanisoli TaxID=2081970 RepID=A0A328UAJ2_9BACL|nr:protein translocase subunit SecF [Paenibacillus montanisoli]RAP77945.1 protein translocase subunit SecF [Paenibacillus montanisoli]
MRFSGFGEVSEGKFDFVKNARYFFIFSIIITVLGVITLGIHGLNYGVDFKAGSNVDIAVKKDLTGQKDAIEQYLKDNDFGSPALTVGANRVTVRFDEVLTDQKEKALKEGFAAKFDKEASAEVNTVDVEIAKELQTNALYAVLVASIGIVIYVSIRFEWRFAIAAIVSLLHDAFIVISLFSIFKLEVNLPFIVAILTIIGYSINDTIVIFDRIRENLRFAKIKTAADVARLVNESIWQTLTRSINTVMTVVVAAACLLIFGSESIKLFSLAILFGLVSGAYSSIFIASQLWLVLKNKQKPKAAVKSPAAS